jgi:CubicO group peptidase (beta-lactamase class C family)
MRTGGRRTAAGDGFGKAGWWLTATAALVAAAGSMAPSEASSPTPARTPITAAAAVPHAYVDYTLPASAPDPLLPKLGDAGRAGLDRAALTHLALRSRLFQSDAMVILKDGRLLDDWRYGKPAEPIEVGAITQSVTGLAIGRLLYTGKLRSLDLPVATWCAS